MSATLRLIPSFAAVTAFCAVVVIFAALAAQPQKTTACSSKTDGRPCIQPEGIR